mgnify:CR=1 FL=1
MFKIPPSTPGAIAPYVESPPLMGSNFPPNMNWDALQSKGPVAQIITDPQQMLPISTGTVSTMYLSTAQGLGVGTPPGELPFTQVIDTTNPAETVMAINENVETTTSSTGTKLAKSLVNTLVAPVQAIAGTVSSLATGLATMAEKVASVLDGSAIKNALNYLENFRVKESLEGIVSSLAGSIEKAVGDGAGLKKLLSQDMDKLSFFRNNAQRITSGIDTASYNISDEFINVIPKDLKMPVGMDLTDMKNVIENFNLKQGALNVLNGVRQGVENIGQEIVTTAEQTLANVNDFFNTLGSELKSGLSSISDMFNKTNKDPTKTRSAQLVIADIIENPAKILGETNTPITKSIPKAPDVPDPTDPAAGFKFASGDPANSDPVYPNIDPGLFSLPEGQSPIQPATDPGPTLESAVPPPSSPPELDTSQITPKYDPLPDYSNRVTGAASMPVEQFDQLTDSQRLDYMNSLPVSERINQVEAYRTYLLSKISK